MDGKIIVLVTCESKQQAEHLAQTLVSEKLAACVNVVPGIRSCYVWEGKLNWSEEFLLVIKTVSDRYSELEQKVRTLHSYSVPEIVAVPIVAGFEKYLKWVDDSTVR